MKDLEFQPKLADMVEDSEVEDEEIVKFVLEHAWNSWPHSFEQWLNQKRRYGGFD